MRRLRRALAGLLVAVLMFVGITPAGASTYVVQKLGDGTVISWNGKPIHYRINWHHFDSTQRLIMRQAIEDITPRIGSGNTNDGQTSLKPNSAKQIWLDEQGDTDLYIYALYQPGTWLAYSEQHWIGDDFKAALIIVNAAWFADPMFGDMVAFRTIMAHELGHAVGLEHPTDSGQVMYHSLNKGIFWQSGDLAGLEVLRNAH